MLPSAIGESVFDTHISQLLPPLKQLYRDTQRAMVCTCTISLIAMNVDSISKVHMAHAHALSASTVSFFAPLN